MTLSGDVMREAGSNGHSACHFTVLLELRVSLDRLGQCCECRDGWLPG